jgi:hypothetical protein
MTDMELVAVCFPAISASPELGDNFVDDLDHLDISRRRTQGRDNVETTLSDKHRLVQGTITSVSLPWRAVCPMAWDAAQSPDGIVSIFPHAFGAQTEP